MKTSAKWDYEAEALLRKGFDAVQRKWFGKQAHKEFAKVADQQESLYHGGGRSFAQIGQGLSEALLAIGSVAARAARLP